MEVIQKSQDRDLVIVGLAAQTDPQRAAADISAHWQRFMSQQISARVAQAVDDPGLYCVYCDYASDHHGAYTLVLGHAVEARAAVPEGLRRVRIPFGRYAQLSFQGPQQQAIFATWQFANERWDGGPRRRYIADYERYAPGAMTPDHVTGQVSIGID